MTSAPHAVASGLTARVRAIAQAIYDPSDLAAISLDDRLKTRGAAFVVLAHAEIEEAIEKACLKVIGAIEMHPPAGFAFLAWGLSSANIKRPVEKDYASQERASGTVPHLVKAYKILVAGSHGVREKHLKRLLLPLGVDISSLALEIATLDAFAIARGDAAHRSPLKTQLEESPSSVLLTATNAAAAATKIIADLDSLALSLKSNSHRVPQRQTVLETLSDLVARLIRRL